MGKLIRALFFSKKKIFCNNLSNIDGNDGLNQQQAFGSMKPIKLSLFDKFKIIMKYNIPCFKNIEFTDRVIYERGQTMLQNDLNFLTLLETLMKIKATLAVIIQNDKNLIQKIHLQYLKLAVISKDDAQQEIFNKEKYEYIKFLEQDERAIIGKKIRKSVFIHNNNDKENLRQSL